MKPGIGLRAAAVALFLAADLFGTETRALQAQTQPQSLEALERAVTSDPENLPLGADYRQRIIPEAKFDRAIDFFEKLAKKKGSGPNVQVSLALAYVDKVPTAGEIRKLFLGRDAMDALSKAIQHKPTVLAYYMRGLINLYYNALIWKRAGRGIQDLEKAMTLITPETPPLLVKHVYVALGDGHYRVQKVDQAREIWKKGLALYPDTSEFASRLSAEGKALEDIVDDALDPDTRVDTSLRGMLQ